MKFKEEICGNCGLDLTTVKPVEVIEMPLKGEMVFIGECPGCHTNRIVVAPEPTPEPPVVIRGGRRSTPEPKTEPEPEP